VSNGHLTRLSICCRKSIATPNAAVTGVRQLIQIIHAASATRFISRVTTMTRLGTTWLVATAWFAFGSLIAGAGYLEWSLPGGLPVGNALTALGLSASALAAFAVSRPNTVLRWFSVVSLILSVGWLPVSIGLAGNLLLNFGNSNGPIWMKLSLVTFACALISVICATVRTMSGKGFRTGSAGAA
jgi:hypothetical protein